MTNPLSRSRWHCSTPTKRTPTFHVVCFPHAGAGPSAYATWRSAASSLDIALRIVHYPGREGRFSDPPIRTAAEMIDALLPYWDQIAPNDDYVVFGHSMGALLAFEMVKRIEGMHLRGPNHLFISGMSPNGVAGPAIPIEGITDRQFLEGVKNKYGSIPDFVMADPKLQRLIVPPLRADLALVRDYPFQHPASIGVPLTVFGGDRDPCAPIAELPGWQNRARSAICVQILQGGHFFYADHGPSILNRMREGLRDSAKTCSTLNA